MSGMVPSRGVRRRIQALHARGWSATALAPHIGLSNEKIGRLLWLTTVPAVVHRHVAVVYERLWNMPPEGNAVGVEWTRRRAERNGWVPPMAWDDIDLDDAPFTGLEDAPADDIDHVAVELAVRGEGPVLNAGERRLAVSRLHAAGGSDMDIARTLRIDPKTVFNDRQKLSLAPNIAPSHPGAGRKAA